MVLHPLCTFIYLVLIFTITKTKPPIYMCYSISEYYRTFWLSLLYILVPIRSAPVSMLSDVEKCLVTVLPAERFCNRLLRWPFVTHQQKVDQLN